jgi:hypothetical protein
MTCNPYWPEITEQLLPGQTPHDRPDVVARVYHAKLRDLHEFMIVKGHFCKVAAWPHVTRVHKTAVNRSVTAVTGLTEPARLLKPTGNRPPNRAYETDRFG